MDNTRDQLARMFYETAHGPVPDGIPAPWRENKWLILAYKAIAIVKECTDEST